MTSINALAAELGAQPHEVAAFADLDADASWTDDLDPDTEAMIRQAWAAAPDGVDVAAESRNEEAVLDDVREIVDRAGYDTEI